ncbi:SMI1/KNR4 family protein [Anoxybacteroides tepidamans]|uniref:SMI1/KNR4 family protein n=1 Tax=Anoxybacteroides tepidamans TaxID=265948 RepID=UPI000483EF34|nr:SMI1/KNR4 family protein [Anoxybacillus tepidamans]
MKQEFYRGKNFWKDNSEQTMSPISEELIKNAEDILGIKLPLSYIELIKQKNGGELNYPYFILPDGQRESIPNMEGICLAPDEGTSILSLKEMLQEVQLPQEFFVLWSDFHHWVVLDYRHTKSEPPVLYIRENYSCEDVTWEFIEIAHSFADFLHQLFRLPPLNPKTLKPSYGRNKQ